MFSAVETTFLRKQHALFADLDAPLSLDEYQAFTRETDKNEKSDLEGLGFVLLGLYGEVGSLLSELKKKQRDKDAYHAYHESTVEELGDTLWYFANAAMRAGLRLSELAHRAGAGYSNWDDSDANITFEQLQKALSPAQSPQSAAAVERGFLALAGKVGLLLEDYNQGRVQRNRDVLSSHLVEIFRLLLTAARDANVNLDEAARKNITKALSRWPLEKLWAPLFDEGFPADERLPRVIPMRFREKTSGSKVQVIQEMNGVRIGDPVTDNRHPPDDYRFHDVFHLSYAALLGWSPTLRGLLKVKRKSDPIVDDNEDGARASLIEEGVSTWIFNHGQRHQFFRNVTSVDYGLLKAVQELVSGYEVEKLPLWQWEMAILEGFRVFRELKHHRGGTVTADLNEHTLTFRAPE
ncbi:nucleoside triphosphate pyrophosphohydrolase family protein [Rhizobiaceae bacterium CRRU44]|uniref:Nucleoside triphosphate pyrophosphohydrolase family protein n=1 Tax=Ferranicluibacter rubi TaxID=2715133 RepID=A0AA43ZH23_9HYPH|nr:nucleoside triphosphate pyrophosphohydrolase family protein [Ferranicluibacter rubi]NHT77743.1 nucleoside triphosphate pyrophosphohydrolase family protein [Ferranicluibacter rubi]